MTLDFQSIFLFRPSFIVLHVKSSLISLEKSTFPHLLPPLFILLHLHHSSLYFQCFFFTCHSFLSIPMLPSSLSSFQFVSSPPFFILFHSSPFYSSLFFSIPLLSSIFSCIPLHFPLFGLFPFVFHSFAFLPALLRTFPSLLSLFLIFSFI